MMWVVVLCMNEMIVLAAVVFWFVFFFVCVCFLLCLFVF